MAASLPILPSPTTTTYPPLPSYNPSSPPKRPRLSLDTQEVAQRLTWAKSSTSSLRLETLSAVSPTSKNTFTNTFEYPHSAPAVQPSKSKPPKPRLSIDSSITSSKPSLKLAAPIALDTKTPSTASTAESASSAGSFAPAEIPYKPNVHIPSILVNSPHAGLKRRRTMTTSARPMFPAAKRVSFRAPLEEEITTTKYVMAHSDLESSASTISTLELPSPEQSMKIIASSSSPSKDKLVENTAESPSRPFRPTKIEVAARKEKRREPKTGDKRDSSDSESDTCPVTPVAGRRKRRREWVWTLGPIEGGKTDQDDSNASAEGSHDDGSESGAERKL